MRTIKFRYWNGNKMNYNPKIGTHEGTYDYSINDEFVNPDEERRYMQFTGLLDKNGKEIYEGDVVSFESGSFEIKWFPKWAMFGLKGECRYRHQSNPDEDPLGSSGSSTKYKPYHLTGYYLKKIEVIGNIYENPELLEVK